MNMRPPPPPTLSKEFSRVWIGWCMIGDREVAREAAAKGIYISLALQFIATRKEWDHSDVERWFKSEILAWVYQLLEQKQIFKASHILSNIGIDPTEQLNNILSETTNKNVRDYTAEHLLKVGKLEQSLLNSWRFITAIEKYNGFTFNKIWDDVSNISIIKIDSKSDEWKANIATVLFFNTYDFCLENFLSPECAWDNLLSNEKIDILKIWINVYFTKDLKYNYNISFTQEIYQKLKNIFLLWEITNKMINQIKAKSYSKIVTDFVLNELSKFGIFINDEKDNVAIILNRISKTQNIQNIINIFEGPTSYLNITEFYEKLNMFCLKNEFYEVLSVCCSTEYKLPNSIVQNIHSKDLSLWLKRNDGIIDEENILKNILICVNYFADNNYNLYFKHNPILLIAIIIFTNDTYLSNIISNNLSINIEDITINSNDLFNILNVLPVFSKILLKYSNNLDINTNIYDLLKLYNTNIKYFEFRKVENTELPHFGNEILSKNYGFSENINYLYYIKQNRPSKAAKLFLKEFQNSNEIDLNKTNHNILQLALKKSNKYDIKSSCISFLEMIGQSTNNLRIVISAINEITLAGLYPTNQIDELFSNLKQNSLEILNILEKIIENKYDFSQNFINIIENYNLPINFAKINNLELPSKFLLHCTENNFWFQFMIFIQIFNYPLEHALKLSMNFKNKEIMEHVYHALSNDIELSLDKNLSASMIASVTSIDLETNEECLVDFTTRTNLLKILIKSHKSCDPPTALLQASQTYKKPLLAILATCYEPDSVVINWLTWLSISTNTNLEIIDNYSISAITVSSLLENVLKKGYVRTLLESFQIFLPENPLHLLAKFLHDCVELNFESSIDHIKSFEKNVGQLNYNTSILPNDFEYTFLTNSYWLIDTALKLIFSTLGFCFKSRIYQIKFLNILCSYKFKENIPIDYPNFCAISKLIESLSSNVQIDLSVFLETDSRRFEIISCIEALIKKKQFKDALELAKFENICKEYVLNEEWLYKFKEKPNAHFWENCEKAFESAEILPSSAALFYVVCCTNLTECSDKYKTLKLAYKWLKQSDYSDQFVESIEQEIWSNYFALDDTTLQDSYFTKHETNYLLTEILERTKTESKFDNDLNQVQLRHLEETLGKILASGDIIEAVRLNKMFNYKSSEIEILLTCYELAEGKIKPYEISTEQRLLFLNRDKNLKSVPHRRKTVKSARTISLSSVSYESMSNTIVPLSEEEIGPHDTLALLEAMTERLKYGSNIASRILMCYRISVNVNKPYHEIVKHTDSVMLLQSVLENNCKNKLEVVQDIFVIYKWSSSEITDFIFNELKTAVNKSLDLNLDCILMWDLDLDLQFHMVLQLCLENDSLLGKKLLSYINAIQETQVHSKTQIEEKQLNIVVELLVRAHDCFNSYCNMEGIASVLRKAQTITSILLNMKCWKLMVRLLTGIGRYTDMNYIFQILKENDQFEYLLKRNFRKDTGLKVALLKFLNKHCPKNQNLFRMVALHFTLFSEVAGLWENEALEMINNLIEIAKLETQNQGKHNTDYILFTNSDSTILCLTKAMNNYTHAAEYHSHGEKLNNAMRAARQAELIALQISILKCLPNNGVCTCILRLTSVQILEVASTELSFYQSKILVESYNYTANWGAILFKQIIINGKLEFLEEFLTSKPLTNTLAQDLTRRFLAEKNITQMSVKAMKEILKKLDSVHMKYRLASELGFNDVIETLLCGSQLAFLKDTVWKRGYKQM